MSGREATALAAWAIGALCGCYGGLGPPPPPSDLRTTVRVTPNLDEQVCPEGVFTPPAHLLEPNDACDRDDEGFCLRLAAEFRAVAGDPQRALEAAAREFGAHAASGDPVALERARAFADLAISGRRAYARFAAEPPVVADDPASRAALARAHAVAWALRGPPSARAALRPELGWIAVSPEDDPPHRPVNVPSSPFAQYDLAVGTSPSVVTRIAIASTSEIEVEPAIALDRLPPERTPVWSPDAEVLVYLHGHSSILEEATPFVGALLEAWRERGRELVVIAFDLPSNGYAERFEPGEVIASAGSLLGFLDRFVDALVDALDVRQPGTRERILAAIGGSLGGNLALRIGERADRWPRAIVAWSPASLDYSWARARPPLAAGDGEYVDLVKFEGVRQTFDASRQPEEIDSRARYFVGGLSSVAQQAGYWYRADWAPCRERMIREGMWQRAETYDATYRRWHYRIAYEQLVFSHVDEGPDGVRPFTRITRPLWLAAGEHDDAMPIPTWRLVERLAPFLTAPGRTVLFEDTGHTIHTERPIALAQAIASFLDDVRAGPGSDER